MGRFNFKWICLILVLLFLAFSTIIVNSVIIMLLTFTFLKTYQNKDDISFYKKMIFWLPSTIVILALMGLLNTSDLKEGFGVIERVSYLIIFPFVFSQIGITKFEFTELKKWFIAIFFLLIIVLEIRLLWLLSNNPDHDFLQYFFSYYYTYENLTTEYIVQPVYLGIYITLSNIFCLSFIKEGGLVLIWRRLLLIILVFNTFFLLQLGARSPILLNLLIISAYLIHIFYEKKILLRGILIVAFVFIVLGSTYLFSGFTRIRMQHTFTEITSSDLKKDDPKSRIIIWSQAIEIIKKNWLIGVGTGDAEDKLIESYRENRLIELYEAELNAHNQYLTLFMRHGILGIIAIIMNFVVPLYICVKRGNLEALFFIFLIAGFFITENVLGRAQGVIFFSLFHSIYLSLILEREDTPRVSAL